MRWMLLVICAVVVEAFLFGAASPARAQVADPTLRTDHPQYAGEGAFQTVEDCVAFATQGKQTPQEKAVALYLWLLTHQFHLYSPQEWNVPGGVPGANNNDYEMVVYDANRGRFSYGYGLCGTVHAWNEPYWRALGMNVRRRAFPGHVNSEVFYNGGWHAFDTDMAGLVFRPDGVVAGYDDIKQNPDIVAHSKPPLPCYPFAWPSDFEGMKNGWRQVAAGGNWYKMYHSGYAGMPGKVQLRRGETFTRYFDRDHFGGPGKRRFWHNQPGGPFRNWTFVNQGTPRHTADGANCRGNASYANGEFVYEPDLTDANCLSEAFERQGELTAGGASPHLRSGDAEAVSVTFGHFSPYVICGDPVDDANPMTGRATGGLMISGRAVGPVTLEISPDFGQTWRQAIRLEGDFERDLTDEVKGRYGWRARFAWRGAGGLDRLRFVTVTQVCQAFYPRLTPNGCQVTYRAASLGVTPVEPNFGLPETAVARYEVKSLRSPNVDYTPRGAGNRYAYRVRGNKPGVVVFRVAAPRPLREVRAAVRFSVRSPAPEGCDFHLDVSLDGGKSWRPLARTDIPTDNEYSSGWMAGKTSVDNPQTKEALVRAHLYAGGYATGLISAEFYGVYQTPPPRELKLTYAWREGDTLRTHEETIAAGVSEHKFRVPTGAKVTDDFVRLEALGKDARR